MSQDNCQDNNQHSNQPNSEAQLINDIIHRWRNKQSIRSIARELGLSRFKVASIIRAHQRSTELPAAEDPAEATPPSLGPVPVLRGSKLDQFEEPLQQLLQRYPRITAKRVYEELQRLGYEGGYSILRVRVKQLRGRPAQPLTIRFETAPGVQAQMDWSTYEIDFTQEGKRRVQLFSYILSYSRRQYIHFTDRQDFETTTRQHIAAFEHLGGVATTCLYDNMKVVVTRWEDGQPVYNTRFLAFATHYGYRPWACQVYRPQTKGKVERPFHYIETNLLNGREFRSLDHLHEVTRWWLAEVADTRVHGTTKKTPLELHAEELPHLLPLPALRFDTAQVVYRIVDTDGTIQYANNRYSVPWQLLGEQLPVRITETELLVYNRSLSLVAQHVLLLGGTGQSHLDPLHAPPKDVEQQRSTLRERYAELGPVGSQFLEGLLAKQRYGKHDAQRVLSLLPAYSLKDILAAMSRAIQYHAYGYQSLERILAHLGTPKPSWEVLSDKEQDALKRLAQADPIGPRRSEDYQHLLKNQPHHDQDQPHQPEPQEPEPQEPEPQEPEPQELPFNDEPSGENPPAPDDAQDPDVSGNA